MKAHKKGNPLSNFINIYSPIAELLFLLYYTYVPILFYTKGRKPMRKFKTAILCTFISIAMLSACGCSNQDSSNSNVASSTNATVTDAGKESDIENVSTTELADLSDNQEVSEETTEAVTEENTTTESASDKKQETTASNKKDEAKADNKKAETTQQITTQNQSTTQAQATTQQSKPGNSGNNGNSQNNSQTTTSHSHTWVNHTKIVHHDAQYEDQEVTKYKKEEHLFCNTCGADITNIGSDAHYAASGTMWINCGTDENPWWVEATRCSGCHGSWISVPYTETEKVKVQDAYDEEIVDYQYCSGCGQRK